jgi:hypothetical protein
METGRITLSDKAAVLRRHPAVLESYLAGPRRGAAEPPAPIAAGTA